MKREAQPPLPRRLLGDTGIAVSVLGLGTTKFGRNKDVKYPHPFELPGDRQLRELLSRAHDHGINLLDTAPAYGESEARIGKLLRGQRQRWIICTKAGESWTDSERGGRTSFYDFSPEAIRDSIARSCQRLATDYLDIVLLHSDGTDEAIVQSGALEVLSELKQRGQLRAFGVSTKTVSGGCLAARQSDVLMLSYRPDHLEEQPVLEACLKYRTGVLLKKVLASGHQPNPEQNLRFVLAHPATSSALVGTINPEHLQAAIDAARSFTQ